MSSSFSPLLTADTDYSNVFANSLQKAEKILSNHSLLIRQNSPAVLQRADLGLDAELHVVLGLAPPGHSLVVSLLNYT